MPEPSGPLRRFVTQVLTLPLAVVVGVAVLIVGGAGGATLVTVDDGSGPQPGAATTKGPDVSANPGLGHGCGHSAGKAQGHGRGLAHAPGQQAATCQAPGRLAGHAKPEKDRPEKGRSENARERAHEKAEKAEKAREQAHEKADKAEKTRKGEKPGEPGSSPTR